MLALCLKSLANRRFVALLTVLSIALSVALIIGVERLRSDARNSFANSASGIDLIVAPRGNDVQILMATVFAVGSTGTGMSWESFEMIEDMPQVAWAVPIMTGDNHRGFPVIGTSPEYFERFRHSGGRALVFERGGVFSTADGAVVGAEVAGALGYEPGTEIVNAHGTGDVSFDVHDENPFTVSGILEPTGTAVDRMVLVSLEGFDAMHEMDGPGHSDPLAADFTGSASAFAPHAGSDASETDHGDNHEYAHGEHADEKHGDEAHGHENHAHDDHGHEPGTINAVYAGLSDKSAILSVQRRISDYREEALSAVLPNVALLQLWSITSNAETALRVMAGAVAVAGLAGMIVMVAASLEPRRREFAILRSVGATPRNIFLLIVQEAGLLLSAGIILGYVLMTLTLLAAAPLLIARYGLSISTGLPTQPELLLIAAVFCFGMLASIVPAMRVYKMTLADGLSIRF